MKHETTLSIFIVALYSALTVGACGHQAGTQPHEMSVAQHEAAAAREEGQASQIVAAQPCANDSGRACWTPQTSTFVAEHRELAAHHRAAAQALRDAEAQACAGLKEEDRDISPFDHVADIRSVSQFKEVSHGGRTKSERATGATIVFRPTQGLTVEWLQRLVNCHLARNAAVGHDMPEMPDCPLVPRGVSASVRSVGDGFAVDVTSDDPTSAAEIWRRAQSIHIKP